MKLMCKSQTGSAHMLCTAVLVAVLTLPVLGRAWAAAPIGLAAIERFDQISLFRPGVRAYQYSSHDPTGGNADAGHFLQSAGGEDVLLDVKGSGCVYRMWQTGGGDPSQRFIRIYLDGATTPLVNMSLAQFFGGSQAPFLSPLVGNDSVSSGGFYCYVPIPFRTGCRISMAGGAGVNYYNITYHRFADATGVATFTGQEDTSAARSVWNGAGSDPKPDHGSVTTSGAISLPNGSTATLANIATGGTIQELEITIPDLSDAMLTTVNLRAQWDGAAAAIDVPIGYFFGCGLGVRNIHTVPVGMDNATKRLYCYLPMPFASSALVQLVNNSGQDISSLSYTIRHTPQSGGLQGIGLLYARYLSETPTTLGRDYTILNETGTGHFIGVVQTMRGPSAGFLEGDERIYVDGSLTPHIYGTGTEDCFNGGWYFNRGPFTLPVHGNPIQLSTPDTAFAVYRFFLSDLIPFTNSIKVGIEHNGTNDGTPNYYSVAFYYKAGQPSSTLTDTLDVGDSSSESAHNYVINSATWSGTTFGYYEGDDDNILVSDNGRRHAGYSQFVAAIDAANAGLLLRRRMNYSLPRQNAQVYIDGALAGEWYEAGDNTSKVFRDSEFMVAASLTQGKSSTTVKIVNTSSESNWTEYRYWVYSLTAVPSDTTPPGNVTGFAASESDMQIDLSWANPTDPDFAGTRVLFKTTGYPGNPSDGVILYNGTSTSCVHTGLTSGVVYYYAAYAYDHAYNYASGSKASVARGGPYCYCDSFPYADGDLNGNMNWAGSATAEIEVVSQAVKITGGSPNSEAARSVSCSGTAGVIGAKVKIRAGSGGVTLWGLWYDDPSGNNLARWYGTGTTARPRIGGTGLVLNPVTLTGGGVWDTLTVHIDTNTDTDEFFFNGTSLGTLSHSSTGAGSSVGAIKFERIYNSTTSDWVYFDNLSVGEPEPMPPGPVTNFKARGQSGQVALSWTNPADPDFVGTMIRYKTTGYPTGPTDGALIYIGGGTTHTHGGLVNGRKYYYSAFAYDAVPNYRTKVDASAHAAANATILEAKGLLNNQVRALRNNIVSAVGSGYFYVQDPTLYQGIKVSAPDTVSKGQKVDVVGLILGQGGERYLDCSGNVVVLIDAGPIALNALAMGAASVGGAELDPYTGGVVGGTGPNNMGLLVKVWGKITQRETVTNTYFYIDDGSGLTDGTQTAGADNVGIKVLANPTSYPTDTYVLVTGAVSTFDSAGLRPQILPQVGGIQPLGP